MNKLFIPYSYAQTLYDIDFSFFIKKEVKHLLCDLDNTLDSYKTKKPSKKALEFKKKCDENSINLIIVSNNKSKRVQNYASALGVKCYYGLKKPSIKKLNKLLNEEKIDKKDAMMIGDQILTDVRCANKAGIRVVLCEKLVKEDQFVTRFNRIVDRVIRKRLKKEKLLVDWSKR